MVFFVLGPSRAAGQVALFLPNPVALGAQFSPDAFKIEVECHTPVLFSRSGEYGGVSVLDLGGSTGDWEKDPSDRVCI